MYLCCGRRDRLTAPAVLAAVSDQDVRLWQRRGAKLLGQRNLTRKGGGQSESRRRDCQHQGGREPGSGGQVNSREAALNAVSDDRRKMLTRLGQNGKWSGPQVPNFCGADTEEPPAESCDL